MTTKRIVVLANSIKHHPMRCVAGRELLEKHGESSWGGWVRPISNHDEGALAFFERRLTNATDPRPLEILNLQLKDQAATATQPENWLIEAGQVWSKERSIEPKSIVSLVEEPYNLWFDPTQKKSDRAAISALTGVPHFQSLYLIRPQNFQFHICSTESGKRARGLFTYRGRRYDFSLTDPLIGSKYFPDYPRTPEGCIEPENQDNVFLCVSLTPAFHELHYKVIASVLEIFE